MCRHLWATWGPTHRNPRVAGRAGGARHTGTEESSAPGLTPFSFLPSGPSVPLLPLWMEMLVGDSPALGGHWRGEGWAQRPQAQVRQPEALQPRPGQPAGRGSVSHLPLRPPSSRRMELGVAHPACPLGPRGRGQCEGEGCYPPSSQHPAGGGRTGTALQRGLGGCLVRDGLPPLSPGPQMYLHLLFLELLYFCAESSCMFCYIYSQLLDTFWCFCSVLLLTHSTVDATD